jgi:hypothetical protein
VRVSEIGNQTPDRLYGRFFAGSFMKIAGSLSFWNELELKALHVCIRL